MKKVNIVKYDEKVCMQDIHFFVKVLRPGKLFRK